MKTPKGAYYNEIDKFAAEWLRNLIKAGLIAPGDVDERSIEDVPPRDLMSYAQCHFFAGIGIWSYALRRAGWRDDQHVWTGSCPCQPFSAAGKGEGFADQRHLWPTWNYLIEECKPRKVFGEQVASKDGLNWIDLVSADLEAQNYAFAATDLCSAGVGAPHIRQRLYFVADADYERLERRWQPSSERRAKWLAGSSRVARRVGNADSGISGRGLAEASATEDRCGGVEQTGDHRSLDAGESLSRGLAHTDGGDTSAERQQRGGQHGQQPEEGRVLYHGSTGPVNGYWRDADWLFCRDERWRPVGPGTFPLVNGGSNRVGLLRAYGNAINAEAATAFIEAAMYATDDL